MSTAVVTGGSRGIGRVICVKLASEGYDIVACYSGNEEAAGETVRLCEEQGVKAVAVKADVSKAEDVSSLFIRVKETFGRPDVLINNAGVTRDGLLISMKDDDFNAVIDTNLKGVYLCTKAAVKEMMRARHGVIINISSVVGLGGNAGQSNYAASKAGIIGFTKSIAKEYGSRGIRVNAVAPGFIETAMTEALPDVSKKKYLDMIPAGRFGKPEDIAETVAFLTSDSASYITGQVICVDGGFYM